MAKLFDNILSTLRGNFYYTLMLAIFLCLALPTWFFGVDRLFFLLYQINYASINNSLTTVFGVLFGFIFTIMALLFSLNENSFFFKLLEMNDRNKADILSLVY